MLLKFRHPDAVFVQIRREDARHIFRDMPPDAALLLGHTAAVDDAAACGFRSCDTANSGHNCGKVAKGAAPPGLGQANLEQDSQRMVKSSSRNAPGACKIGICI
jgi:hypothetical protein